MSTHAGIGMVQKDGSVKSVYLQFDGYPSGAGAILAGWYNTPARIEELLELGDLRSLGSKIAPMPGVEHTLGNPQPDVVVAYNRDYCDEPQPAQIFPGKAEYERNGKAELDADYLYLFEDGRWLVWGVTRNKWVTMDAKFIENN